MTSYLFLPLVYIHFWFLELPWMVLRSFRSLNATYLQVTSLPLLIRTFFKPLKNEYRKGLVGFSIGMGIVVKTMLISVSLAGLIILMIFEIAVFFAIVLAPIWAITLLFR